MQETVNFALAQKGLEPTWLPTIDSFTLARLPELGEGRGRTPADPGVGRQGRPDPTEGGAERPHTGEARPGEGPGGRNK